MDSYKKLEFLILVLQTAEIFLHLRGPIQVADDYEIITRKQVRADVNLTKNER